MAQTWPSKAPTEVVERRWTVPVADEDGLSSFTVSVSGITKDSQEVDGNDAVVVLSAGTGGATATITITATTSDGLTLVETFYLPIQATTVRLANTAADVTAYALRKVVGIGEDAEAAEQADALERLNDMLAAWKGEGADVGVPLPALATDTLYVPDAFLGAIKANLLVKLAELYGEPVTPLMVTDARQGLARIKNALLADERGAQVYY